MVYIATLSDSEPEEGEISPIERNFFAFMACHVSDDDTTHVNDTSEEVLSESHVSEGEESDEEEIDVKELQNAFNELYDETVKVKKANSKLQAKLNERAIENNDSLIEDLRQREKKFREKLEFVAKERDNLCGLMESLKKEILEFEESRHLLESTIHELEERLRDSSRVKFDLETR